MIRTIIAICVLHTAVSLNSNAQTTVCIDDTVCLILNGYTGSIQWQGSPDGNTFTSIVGATSDTSCVAVSDTTYYRAEVTDDGCDPFYSDTTLVYTIGGAGSDTFNFTGVADTFIVPVCIDSLHIEVWGAEGGTPTNNGGCGIPDVGGLGGNAVGDLLVSAGDTLFIYVGQAGQAGNVGGWNGGGNTCVLTMTCSKGGGASDVRFGGDSLNDRIIVGGGGGGAEYSCGGLGGGDGAYPNGADASGGDNTNADGFGGTQVAGGIGGANGGNNGTFGVGGSTQATLHVGSGGGGWYGGGGGGQDGHAGGGSSYIDGVLNGTTTNGVQTGDGLIIISW